MPRQPQPGCNQIGKRVFIVHHQNLSHRRSALLRSRSLAHPLSSPLIQYCRSERTRRRGSDLSEYSPGPLGPISGSLRTFQSRVRVRPGPNRSRRHVEHTIDSIRRPVLLVVHGDTRGFGHHGHQTCRASMAPSRRASVTTTTPSTPRRRCRNSSHASVSRASTWPTRRLAPMGGSTCDRSSRAPTSNQAQTTSRRCRTNAATFWRTPDSGPPTMTAGATGIDARVHHVPAQGRTRRRRHDLRRPGVDRGGR